MASEPSKWAHKRASIVNHSPVAGRARPDISAKGLQLLLDNVRNEVLEEAAAVCDYRAQPAWIEEGDDGAIAASVCSHSIRALKHTEDTDV